MVSLRQSGSPQTHASGAMNANTTEAALYTKTDGSSSDDAYLLPQLYHSTWSTTPADSDVDGSAIRTVETLKWTLKNLGRTEKTERKGLTAYDTREPGSTVAKRTLEIGELLETILLFLPLRDLLFAQGVCRDWRDNIEHSPRLQQRLFFRPIPCPNEYVAGYKLQKNTFFEDCFWIQTLPERTWDEHYRVHLSPRRSEYLKSNASRYPEASWRRMLLTQPGLRDVESWGGPGTWARTFLPVKISDPKAIRLAQLLKPT